MWKNLHDNRDRGKIKVLKYLENAVKSKLSVRTNLSWPSLKKSLRNVTELKISSNILCILASRKSTTSSSNYFL